MMMMTINWTNERANKQMKIWNINSIMRWWWWRRNKWKIHLHPIILSFLFIPNAHLFKRPNIFHLRALAEASLSIYLSIYPASNLTSYPTTSLGRPKRSNGARPNSDPPILDTSTLEPFQVSARALNIYIYIDRSFSSF